MRNPTTFRYALACAALGFGGAVGAQPTSAVHGRVIDAERGTPVADVRVHLIAMPGAARRPEVASLTSATGTFALQRPTPRLAGNTLQLVAARLGFAPETATVHPDEVSLTVGLRVLPLRLAAVNIADAQSFGRVVQDCARARHPTSAAHVVAR